MLGAGEHEQPDVLAEQPAVEGRESVHSRKKATALKLHYDNACQFCGAKIQVGEDRFYSEVVHIKGLGEPHNGPDVIGNMLVLCLNHRIQFDCGALRLEKIGEGYVVRSKSADDPLNGREITISHTLDDACVEYHYRRFGSTRS